MIKDWLFSRRQDPRLELITGNLFVLTGIVLFAQLAVLAVSSQAARRRATAGPAGAADATELTPNPVTSG